VTDREQRDGFVYVATGAGYVTEAMSSAASLRTAMPQANICLITDAALTSAHPFDTIIVRENVRHGPIDKTLAIHAPYERVVFLDTDTFVAADLSDLFAIVDNFDVAALPETKRGWYYELPNVPRAFAEFNTGVLVFRRTEGVRAFFERWTTCYGELQHASDQPAFRLAMWQADLRVAPLPSEYHFLGNVPNYVMWDAKLIHARGDLRGIERQVNRVLGARTFLPDLGVMQAHHGRRGWTRQMFETFWRMTRFAITTPPDSAALNPGKWWVSGRSETPAVQPTVVRERLRHLGLGRVAYATYFAPLSAIRRSIREGGPIEQWRTAAGRVAMERAVRRLPPMEGNTRGVELHVLSGRAFWYQTAFCLWTFAQRSARGVRPVIYDDGTLEQRHADELTRLFPTARIETVAQIADRMDEMLPASRYPALRERWSRYPNIRKLTDVHAGSTGWKLVIDSDLLFFRRPDAVLAWLDAPRHPLHAADTVESYGYSRPLLESLAGTRLADRVNVGLTGLRSETIDWDRIESWCRTLVQREGHHYYLEQALVAMLVAGTECTVLPAQSYVTGPVLPEAAECRAVMHHYVDVSKRWYFRQNWRRAVAPVSSMTPGAAT
jgi:hypothetical protein